MEGSIFSLNDLRRIGFHAYPTVVRARLWSDGVPSGVYTNFSHIVIIIELADRRQKYACDVPFGDDGTIVPMPVEQRIVNQNLGQQDIRFEF